MMNTFKIIVLTFAAITFSSVYAGESKLQSKCPVTGAKINKNIYVDAAGQRIYLCCKGCVPIVKGNPEKALEKIGKNGEYTESRQKLCPAMKSEINKDLFFEYKGRRLYACCPPCVSKFKKDPAAYAKKISEITDGKKEEKKASSAKQQTTCPIMGNKINKNLYVDTKGYRIYVCCPPCKKKILDNPEEAVRKIRSKGEEPEKNGK